ncbi:NAD(P)-binding protein [Hypoxylon rubiginosum]|uniref:NAD(P)-binding protein n=1 Tax=Hypoxylon rubiginosum TaxID=110542 RepID=A0ACB9Z198_9PEZI|nr:NAD(P)-binding protein [Hypoxylon rubiginosum]
MLLHVSPRRLLNRFVAEPLPLAGSFGGQTVVVTGGTAGIGLAAAMHFARLGANVIITYRDAARGQAAKRKIEESVVATGAERATVTAMELDMGCYASCVAFVDELKKRHAGNGGVDVVVLNAGSINPQFKKSAEGWEQTIQVNALSTILLALLLLPWMKEERARRQSPAHMVFTSSRDHLYPSIKHWPEWAESQGILHHLSDEKNWPSFWATSEPNYANSKLLLMYGVREVVDQALGTDGEPEVIATSYCPGTVRTEISRGIAGYNWLARFIAPIYLAVLGKSPDHGARHCVTAALRSKQEHGKFTIVWLTDEQYLKKAVPNMTSDSAKKVQALVWKEIVDELAAKVPVIQNQSAQLESPIEK